MQLTSGLFWVLCFLMVRTEAKGILVNTTHSFTDEDTNTSASLNFTLPHTVITRKVPQPFDVMPENVAFSVRNATETLHAFAHVNFQEVLTNTGGGWDVATSEFIAPIDGGYFFIFHAVGDRTNDFTMSLTKNGVLQVTAYGTMTTFEHGSNSVFLELQALDKVSLQLQQGSIYEHPGNETYTTFTGFLLYRA